MQNLDMGMATSPHLVLVVKAKVHFVNEMEPARPSAAAVADTVVSMLAFPALRAAR